jgi:hypothetical protein
MAVNERPPAMRAIMAKEPSRLVARKSFPPAFPALTGVSFGST